MPGSLLKNNVGGSSYEAPWWAPPPLKEQAFTKFCGQEKQAPTRIDWILDSTGHKVVLTHKGKVVINKRATSVEIRANGVRLWNKKGQGEDLESLWSI